MNYNYMLLTLQMEPAEDLVWGTDCYRKAYYL